MPRHPLRSPLFPYTTLFRSGAAYGYNGHTYTVQAQNNGVVDLTGVISVIGSPTIAGWDDSTLQDRKSTRVNSSHTVLSYVVVRTKIKIQTPSYSLPALQTAY